MVIAFAGRLQWQCHGGRPKFSLSPLLGADGVAALLIW
jgi:hypothetical protein